MSWNEDAAELTK